jgi:alpha-glucosidase
MNKKYGIAAVACLLVLSAGRVRATDLGPVTEVKPGASFVEVVFAHGRARIAQKGEGVLRVRAVPGTDFSAFPSFAVLPNGAPETAPRETAGGAGKLVLDAGRLHLVIDRASGAMTVTDPAGVPLLAEPDDGGASFAGAGVACEKTMPPDEHYYGFGEKHGPLDKRGLLLENFNHDGYDGDPAQPMYQTHPFFMTLRAGRAAGLLFDNTFRSRFDVGASRPDRLRFSADGGELDYYVFAGPTPADVLRQFTGLTGRMPLPPRWALGYHQCRWSYKNAAEVRSIRDGFKLNDIPVDAIWLDIHYMQGYRLFTFNQRRFPDPAGLIAELRRDGIRTVVIVDPGVKVDPGYPVYDEGLGQNYFVRDQAGQPYMAYVWPGKSNFPDFFRPEVRDWWGGLHRFYTDLGIAGIWNDMNEPAGWDRFHRGQPHLGMVHGAPGQDVPAERIHNVYGLLEAQATYTGLRALRPAERPFILTRAGFSGIWRWAAVWTGDNSSRWDHLAEGVPMLLNMSVSGIAWAGNDIGGFNGKHEPELYARWIEQGAFQPFCRTHSADSSPPQQPWSFGPEVTAISREMVRLRYRLLPYTYSYWKQAADSGAPIMRPLFFAYPADERAAAIGDEYLWGEWLLVAPVLAKGATSRTVYLPAGEWIDYASGEKIAGPAEREVSAPLGKLPLFVKAGAVLALGPDTSVGKAPAGPLTIKAYPGREPSAFTLYEDDGESFAYEQGASAVTELKLNPLAGGYELTIGARSGPYAPGPRELEIWLPGPESARLSLTGLDGRPRERRDAAYVAGVNQWFVKLPDDGQGTVIRVSSDLK